MRRLGLSLLLSGLLALVACQFVAYPAREATRIRDPHVLSIATFNTWLIPIVAKRFTSRLARMPRAIAGLDPDVVCFQEVWTDASSNALVRGLREALPHHAPGRGGLLICSRHPVRSSRFTQFPLHEGLSLEEFLAAKGMLEAVIATPQGDVRVVTAHLALAKGDDPELTAAHEAQLTFLIERLHQLRDLPLFVAADLNLFAVQGMELDPNYPRVVEGQGFVDSDPPEHFDVIPGSPNLRDVWSERKFTRVRWPPEHEPDFGWSPDYVLARPGGGRSHELLSHTLHLDTPGTALSDHRLVLTRWRAAAVTR